VLDGDLDLPNEGEIFKVRDIHGHARRHSAVRCAKTAKAIEKPFQLWTRVCYMGVQISHANEQF